LIRNQTQNDMGSITAPTAPQRFLSPRKSSFHSFSRTKLHLRALLRMARRRPSIAMGLVLAVGSAVATTAVVGTYSGHSMFQASVTPLAPAPAPPSPPKFAVMHRLLSKDLARMNPLRGLASWYGDVWNGRTTASGETFDETKLTAAHKTLPLGTLVRVTDLRSRRTVVVKINDRGTLTPQRVIDLSSAAARELGILEEGLARVKLEVIGKV
jgi:rare lipoprotein A